MSASVEGHRGIESPGAGVTGHCELAASHGCWDPNSGLLLEQYALFHPKNHKPEPWK